MKIANAAAQVLKYSVKDFKRQGNNANVILKWKKKVQSHTPNTLHRSP